ncbi:H-NS histone family protein [Burkholderia multivorans]|uniref:H-NS histone family protein n=1 Tax=Burkholderia multivorans TaxID=87883 RepID=UPI002019D5A9|nr:H-NS histone family protein [Burkholderia multivorans]MCA8143596.1 H-NS histone family protein [Burkholderia multivorans]MCO1368604.1 H-NS histone family protein [Burkholderia multivorans]MCO1380495.1 H-NS histone family protein [Burkholderia multivorans]MDN8032388.1 H-NS histone family protein [Burkholderia multivorans]UQP21401.1 H-NS histone family protein [Burkholderia multivorans]
MSTYQELLAQRTALEAEIDAAKGAARANALTNVRQLISEFNINSREIYGVHRQSARRRPDPKYRDPETGATWSCRGRPPAWIEGKDRVPIEIEQHVARS